VHIRLLVEERKERWRVKSAAFGVSFEFLV
jgi:hypothetical protein